MHVVMIFLDGFGLGSRENNPIYEARTPTIDGLLGGNLLWGREKLVNGKTVLMPLEATLGVPGIPQSATGQTTLWTGINAAQRLGYHLNAYPNEELRSLIAEHSIFRQLADTGKTGMFANAFTLAYDQAVAAGKRRHTASTLSALAGGVRLRRAADLLEGLAVYQDMTNEFMRQMGEAVPLYTAFEAGQNLGRLALKYDFTLYEVYQTDVKGHKQLWTEAIELIEQIDRLVGGFLSMTADQEIAMLLTSDHGNLEDFAVKGHTRNPVPALWWSNVNVAVPQWSKLEEVTPELVRLLTIN